MAARSPRTRASVCVQGGAARRQHSRDTTLSQAGFVVMSHALLRPQESSGPRRPSSEPGRPAPSTQRGAQEDPGPPLTPFPCGAATSPGAVRDVLSEASQAQRTKPSVSARKGQLEALSPTERDWPRDAEEEHVLRDPAQELDTLPQPYRRISKLVDLLFERSWELIQERGAFSGRPRAAELSQAPPPLCPLLESREDASKQPACLKVEFSPGGSFAAFLLQGAGDTWLDVYKLPRETWLKEAEYPQQEPRTVVRQLPVTPLDLVTPDDLEMETDAGLRADSKLTPPAHLLRIRPPRPLTGSAFRSPLEAFAKVGGCYGLGSGQNHFIKDGQWEQRASVFEATYRKHLPAGAGQEEPPRAPALWGRGQQEGSAAVHVGVSVQRPAAALGLGRCRCAPLAVGLPLGVVALPEGCLCQSVHFLAHRGHGAGPHGASRAPLKCVVLGTDASLHLVAAQGAQGPTIHPLVDRSVARLRDCRAGVTFLAAWPEASCAGMAFAGPAAPSVPWGCGVLTFAKNGSLQLLDVAKSQAVCAFALPRPCPLTAPWKPLFVVSSHHPCFLLRGHHPDEIGSAQDRSFQNSLFYFNFEAYPPLESVTRSCPSARAEGLATARGPSLEERCESFLQQRFEKLERSKVNEQERWPRLRKFSIFLERENKK
ncbi:PREDICTED: WD repeat-containing protein 93 [Condylura cristata]|uniref:WD repeat-containing protein 93 n=1 Tax=Condylura cristata TaxID=143302 RepID=UPI0006430B82|nr:PREDICTED: WD repeat-containing protein 93 [Condylura cristata]